MFSYIINHAKTSYRLCEGEAKYTVFQILIGIKYLHDREISHRGDNRLISAKRRCMFIHFVQI